MNHNFPKLDTPHVYTLSDVQHELIDDRSKEVTFGGVYDWFQKPSLVNLIVSLERVFRSKPV